MHVSLRIVARYLIASAALGAWGMTLHVRIVMHFVCRWLISERRPTSPERTRTLAKELETGFVILGREVHTDHALYPRT